MAFNIKAVNKVSDAGWFLKEVSEKFNWQDLSDDIVMDIGCGTGKSSATFLELFPSVQKLIAIDLYKKNTDAAQAKRPHKKLEYQVADIQDSSELTQWEGKMSKAISTYCFNCVRRMEDSFENLWKLLQPEGEAALLIKLLGPFDKALEALYNNHEWNPYLAPFSDVFPPDHILNMTGKDYQSIAERTGFEVIEAKESERLYDYDSEEEYGRFLFYSLPLVKEMNHGMEVKFKEHIVELMMDHNPKTEDGKPCIRNNVVSLLLRRPPVKVQEEKLN